MWLQRSFIVFYGPVTQERDDAKQSKNELLRFNAKSSIL